MRCAPCCWYRTQPGTRIEPQVQVFLFAGGCLRGPEVVSLLGVRLAKEQNEVGSSLFAQPMMVAATPLAPASPDAGGSAAAPTIAESAEERLLAAIARLEDGGNAADTTELGDHLALLRRWYYRPEKQRAGVAFFRERDAWPIRRMVRAAAKLAAPAAAETAPSVDATTQMQAADASPTLPASSLQEPSS